MGIVLFGWIATATFVDGGNTVARIDAFWADWMLRHHDPGLLPLMRGLSLAHGTMGILVLAALWGIVLYRRAEWWWWRALVFTVPGGMLLNVWLKEIFQRARPMDADPRYLPHSFSFPSGHAAYVCLFYGLLVVWLFSRNPPLPTLARYASACAAALLCVMVGVSRVWLGVHFASDILAGAAEACAWIALSLMLTAFLARRANHGKME
jgi:membrane-associated phospholipid phosphatase